MKIHVLGCSAAELPDSRLSSFLIDERILLDAGTIGSVLDESAQWKIKHVLLTHAHLDHIKDLPFFADNISISNKKYHVTVIGIPDVIHALKNNLFNDVVWPDFTKIPTAENPIVKLKSIDIEKTFIVSGYKITAYKVNHTVPAVGYVIEDKRGKKLLYTGDTGPNEKIWNSLNRTHLHGIIIEVSLPNRHKNLALKTGHLTPELLRLELEKMIRLPDTVYITHYKPVYKKRVQQELKKLNISNMKILKEGEIHEILLHLLPDGINKGLSGRFLFCFPDYFRFQFFYSNDLSFKHYLFVYLYSGKPGQK
jgi:ribonuclease BN (tRNA processing enzyme)